MKVKKAAKTTKKAAGRRAIPYALISKLVAEGNDALTIAKRINRVNDGEDKSHTVRAIISSMRSKGWKDDQGKIHKLKIERVGQVKKTKGAAKKSSPKPKANGTPQLDGKSLSAGAGRE